METDEIETNRADGRVGAEALSFVQQQAAAGTTLTDLDEVARSVLARAGATSPFLGYQPSFAPVPFPAVICVSLNDAALHGIPSRRRLETGDLVSIDFGATLDGWVADAALTFTVGPPTADDERLLNAASRALRAGIAAAEPGARIGDISAAISAVGRAAGYGLNTDFGGHGVGRSMHEPPSVPNEGLPGRGLMLSPGLVVASEPWVMAGGNDKYQFGGGGRTMLRDDGSRAAHVEHTIAVTADGPVILTAS